MTSRYPNSCGLLLERQHHQSEGAEQLPQQEEWYYEQRRNNVAPFSETTTTKAAPPSVTSSSCCSTKGDINNEVLSLSPSSSQSNSRQLAVVHANTTASAGDNDGYQLDENAFPFLLYDLLQDAEQCDFEDIISWNPDGKGFTIHDRDKLQTEILPHHCRRKESSKYRSFHRQINLYNFSRNDSSRRGGRRGLLTTTTITTITNSRAPGGSYWHPHFRRGLRKLCHLITRKKVVAGHHSNRPTSTPIRRIITNNKNNKKKPSGIHHNMHHHHNEASSFLRHPQAAGDSSSSSSMIMNEPQDTLDIIEEIIATFTS